MVSFDKSTVINFSNQPHTSVTMGTRTVGVSVGLQVGERVGLNVGFRMGTTLDGTELGA